MINNNETNEILKKYVEKIKKEIGINDHYIKWLEVFTAKHPRFTDSNLMFKDLNYEDSQMFKIIGSLYEVIDVYANNNYIYLHKRSKNSGCYIIKYNNIGYEIGYIGEKYYCSRINIMDDNYINFEDILSNKKQPYTDNINKMLTNLKTIIKEYYDKGIPLSILKESVTEFINKSYNNAIDGKEIDKDEYKRI